MTKLKKDKIYVLADEFDHNILEHPLKSRDMNEACWEALEVLGYHITEAPKGNFKDE
ncbi:MAG: hypothetical protein H8D94_01825 [Candidatus Pelagibacter sp.]|nr:hypothetical protein [Candidatus Pelagibacter sp.]